MTEEVETEVITENVKEAPKSRTPDQIKVHGDPKSSKFQVPDPIVQVKDVNLYYGEKIGRASCRERV